MPAYPTTPFERAVDRAVAGENARYLADPAAQASAARQGTVWRIRMALNIPQGERFAPTDAEIADYEARGL